MKELLVLPVFGMIFLGIGLQLVDIAESTGAKAVDYAEDMNMAMDCAVRGVELEKCSPDLLEHDFEPEINRTLDASKDIIEKTQVFYSDDIKQITRDGDKMIIELDTGDGKTETYTLTGTTD